MALRTLNSECAYTVQPGDTLSGIAADFGVSIPNLRDANGLPVGAKIVAGQRLFIPGHTCLVQPVIVETGTYGRGWGGYGGGGVWHGGGHHGHHGGGGHGGHGGGHHHGGMHGLADAWAVPATVVPADATVKVQFNAASATVAQLEQFKSALLAYGYIATGLDGPGWLSPTVSVLMKQVLFSTSTPTLFQYAQAAFNAAMSVGIVTQSTNFTAGIYSYGGGSPVGGSVIGQPVIPNLTNTVNPGDQVKVTALVTRPAGSIANSNARAAAVLAGMGYAVIGIDAGSGISFGIGLQYDPAYVLVQATQTTTLNQVAADVNYALSSVGFGVSQDAGGIYASFYSRGNAYLPAGVPTGAGNPNANPFGDIGKAVSDAVQIPVTGTLIAVVAAIAIIIVIKT